MLGRRHGEGPAGRQVGALWGSGRAHGSPRARADFRSAEGRKHGGHLDLDPVWDPWPLGPRGSAGSGPLRAAPGRTGGRPRALLCSERQEPRRPERAKLRSPVGGSRPPVQLWAGRRVAGGGGGAWRSGLHPRPHCPAPILSGMPPASTCHISRQTAVGDDRAPGAPLVPLPPPATLCCSPERQTLAQSGRGSGRGPWPIWAPTLFSDPRKHVFLLLLSEQGGQQPQDREPRPALGREVGTWAEPRAPVLCPTPPAPLPPVLSLQGLLARCSRVTPPPPPPARRCPRLSLPTPRYRGSWGTHGSLPWSAICVY